MSATTYTILGTTDEHSECDCCGRTELKSTVALQPTDGGEPVYFGVTCAARALKCGVKEVKSELRAQEKRADAEKAAAARARSKEACAQWFAFLNRAAGPGEVFDQIQRLGGIKAARALRDTESK